METIMIDTLREVTLFVLGASLCALTGFMVAMSLERGHSIAANAVEQEEAIFTISRHEGQPIVITWIKGGI